MEKPLFGKINLDPEVLKAVQSASRQPCAVCGSRRGLVVRSFTPRKPQAFCIPDTVAIYVALCEQCKHICSIELETHLLTCRALKAAEVLGIPLGLED